MSKFSKMIVGLLMAVLLFSGCKTAYQKVNADQYRTKTERNLLAKPCSDEFPCAESRKDTVLGVDSAEHNKALMALYQQFDVNIAQQDSIMKLIKIIEAQHGSLTSEEIIKMINAQRIKDSVNIIRNFLKGYSPPPVYKYIRTTITIRDSAALNELRRRFDKCQENEESLEQTVKNNKKWKLWFYIAVGAGVLLILLLIGYLINQLKKTKLLKSAVHGQGDTGKI